MEENLFLFIRLLYLMAVLYLMDLWNTDEEDVHSDSEMHARTRYAVADRIQKELED